MASNAQACREYVNRNAACPTANKSPELVARFADGLLRKSNKASEEADVEQALTDTVRLFSLSLPPLLPSSLTYTLNLGAWAVQMTVFKYVEDKDVFMKFYSKMLSSRLIKDTSASEDAESSMIGKLKDACGFEYTSKLQRMFQDMQLNRDLNAAFKEKMAQTHAIDEKDMQVDFSALVLSTAAWPLSAPTTKLNMPAELVKSKERFEQYYLNKHSGRKLTWLWQHCRNELRLPFFFRFIAPSPPFEGPTD